MRSVTGKSLRVIFPAACGVIRFILVGMSEYIHKSHNVTVLMYHIVLPAKYRRVIFDDEVDGVLKDVCLDIENRYQIKFLGFFAEI